MADPTSDTSQPSIADFYQQYLGRAPDQGGLDFWTNTLTSGQNSLADIQNAIKNSQEGQAFASRGGLDSVSPPQQTAPTSTIVPIEPEGWPNPPAPGSGIVPIEPGNWPNPPAPGSGGILNSPQGNAINQYYNQYLGRNAEDTGMQFWLDQMDKGASFADIQQAIANSPEAQTYAANQSTANSPTNFNNLYSQLAQQNQNQPSLLYSAPPTMGIDSLNAANQSITNPFDFNNLYSQLSQQNQNQPGLLYSAPPMIGVGQPTTTQTDPITEFVKNISQQPQYLQRAFQQQMARFNDPVAAARAVLGSLK